MTAPVTISTVIFDSADPAALAAFYTVATGLPITSADDDFVYLGDGPISLGFQRVPGYQGPAWPDPAKHAHLDFKAADKEKAIQDLLAAGAKLPEHQPGGEDWTVLVDPEGHPFCVAAA